MPALSAFGRKWKVGTDDFVYPGLMDLIVKLCWLAADLIIFWKGSATFECEEKNVLELEIYLWGIFFILLVSILMDVMIIKLSATSYMSDTESRLKVVPCLYIRFFLICFDVLWTTLGAISSFGHPSVCDVSLVTFTKRFIVCNWIATCIFILMCAIISDPFGKFRSLSTWDYDRLGLPYNDRAQAWETRCKMLSCLCCRPYEDDVIRNSFQEIGKLFGFFFQDTNLVPTDVAVGLVAIYVHNRQLKKAAEQESTDRIMNQGFNPRHKPAIAEDTSILATAEEICCINYYLELIVACYGWVGVLAYNWNRKREYLSLWKGIKCCACWTWRKTHTAVIEGDNCCFCNTAAMIQISKRNANDIVYASFKSGFFEQPFFVVVDHKTKAVVVSIRGTGSIKDVITDLTIMPSPISFDYPPSYMAHQGVVLAAYKIQTKLEELQILKRLLQQNHYQLVFVGQSSGAAVATVLGFWMLKEFPDLKVYAYSPAALFSLDAAKFSERFVTTVTYGDDVVARLTFGSFANFKREVMCAVEQCRTPKYKLMTRLLPLHGKKLPDIEFSDVCKAQVTSGPNLSRYKSSADMHMHLMHDMSSDPIFSPMYMPGKILHITEKQSELDKTYGCKWQFKWVHRKAFGEIITSPRMLQDHLHIRMEKALQEFEFVIKNSPDRLNRLNDLHDSNC